MNQKKWFTLLRLVLSVAIILFVFSQIDLASFVEHLRTINLGLYGIGVLCYFGFIALWSLRWWFIIRAANENAPLSRVFTTTLVGNFFAMFLPEAVGSDLARMYGLKERTSANIVSTVLLDRVIGLVSLVLMAAVALLVGSNLINNQSIILLIIGLIVFFVVGWIIFFNRRFIEWCFKWLFKLPLVSRTEKSVRALYDALYYLHDQPRLLLMTLALSLLVQSAEIISVIFVAHALGLNTAPSYFFIFLPIVWIVTLIPISISGLGVREGTFVFFFTQVGVAASDAVAMSLLYYSFRIITGVIGGLIFMRMSLVGYKQKPVPAEQADG